MYIITFLCEDLENLGECGRIKGAGRVAEWLKAHAWKAYGMTVGDVRFLVCIIDK